MYKYQIRTYTLDSEASADAYEKVWQNHLSSLPKCGICAHGIWRPVDRRDQLTALVSFSANEEPSDVDRRYLASPGFQEDFEGFAGEILGVETVLMTPTTASPMR